MFYCMFYFTCDRSFTHKAPNGYNRVPTGHGNSWNLGRPFSRHGKSWKINSKGHGKSCRVMEWWKTMLCKFYNCTEQFCKTSVSLVQYSQCCYTLASVSTTLHVFDVCRRCHIENTAFAVTAVPADNRPGITFLFTEKSWKITVGKERAPWYNTYGLLCKECKQYDAYFTTK